MALPDGIPVLLGIAEGLFLEPTALLSSDLLTGYGFGAAPQWGLYQNGAPVVIADTVTDFGYSQDWAISDYPVERGGFESYDKVNTPFRIKIQFVSGGDIANREALLSSIAAIGDTLDLYDVVTPEAVYTSVNVESYSYRRTSRNGLGLMIVDVGLLEIREDGTQDFKNPASPSGYGADVSGNVQSPVISDAIPSGVA